MNDTGGPNAPAPAPAPHPSSTPAPGTPSAPDTAAPDTAAAPGASPAGPDGDPASAGIPYMEARVLRRAALWAGLLFLPATLLGVVLALSSEAGTACVMRGTCREIPGWLYATTLAVAGGAWLRALTVPDGAPPTRARWAALWTLIGAETIFLCLVMGYFLP
ncbi:hypothetical protein ACFVU3_18985 [Streptomyces sp. NPDC058052]|uniref:hypothetical protein n=1 Tax=Streptomyces sp. NPDC058052 TaxID=3346316 RepID=UPI0036ED09B6